MPSTTVSAPRSDSSRGCSLMEPAREAVCGCDAMLFLHRRCVVPTRSGTWLAYADRRRIPHPLWSQPHDFSCDLSRCCQRPNRRHVSACRVSRMGTHRHVQYDRECPACAGLLACVRTGSVHDPDRWTVRRRASNERGMAGGCFSTVGTDCAACQRFGIRSGEFVALVGRMRFLVAASSAGSSSSWKSSGFSRIQRDKEQPVSGNFGYEL